MIHNDSDITRFSTEFPCPICGGHPDEPRGNGLRCFGFLSDNGIFANCTREEFANTLERNERSNTFSHLMSGQCRCGNRHDDFDNGHRKIVAKYDYVLLNGDLAHQTLRYEPKDFRQRRPDGAGGWIWNIKGIEPVLYRLPEVVEAIRNGEPVLLCEGEKDADRAVEELGLSATTCPMGAKKWRDSYTQILRGANVIAVPHNDKDGRAHITAVVNQLQGVAKSIKVVELPGVPENGGDLSDWIDTGGTKQALLELPGTTATVHTVVPGSSLGAYGAFRIADCADPKPREYLIENFTEGGHATYLYGGAGTMKSLIGTLACVAVASPDVHNFCGLPVKKHGSTVIFDSELNLDELVRRTRQLCAGLGIVVPRDLYYKSAVGQPADETFPSLLGLCEYVGAVMTSIDSLGFAVRGSAEDYDDMKHALHDHIDPLRNIGTTPLVIDHKPHQGDNLFGSVAKTFHGRYIFLAEDLDGELHTPGKRNVRITNKKESFGPKGRKIHLRFSFTPNDGPISIVVVGAPEIPDSYEDLTLESRVQRALIQGDKTKKEIAIATGIHTNTLGSLLPAMRDKGMLGHAGKKGREILYTVSGKGSKEDSELPGTTEGTGMTVPGSSSEVTLNKYSSQTPSYRDMSGTNIKVVSDHSGLNEMVETLSAVREPLGFDVETYPRDETASSLDPRRGKVGVISLSSQEHTYVIDRKAFAVEYVLGALEKVLPGRPLVAHNATFDLAFLRRDVGYEHRGPVFDTLVLDAMHFYATGPLAEKDNWRGFVKKDKELGYKKSLSAVAEKFLGVTLDKGEQLSDWGGELTEEMISYAALDTAVLLPLKDVLLAELENLGMGSVVEIESRFSPAMTYCSDNGFAFDVDGWKKHAAKASSALEAAKEKCSRIAPEPPEDMEWSWSASNHRKVGLALEMLGAKVDKNSSTGNYKTDEAALKVIKRPKKAKELACAILELRAHEKYVTTYGESWFRAPEVAKQGKNKGRIKQGSPGHMMVVEGRVHTQHNQLVATGRGSSKSPNLQNLPEDLRGFFIAPKGRKLLVADYEQMEYVAAAYISGDEVLLGPVREGADYHSMTAEMIGVERPVAKMVNFALLYGMSKKTLAQRLEITEKRAQEYIDAIRSRAPGLGAWCEEQSLKAAGGQPYAKTPLGRVRLVDQNYRRYREQWESNRSQMLNQPIQGGCADGYKIAAALLWERQDEFLGNPLLVNMIHDEFVLEVDAEKAESEAELLEEIMKEGMQAAFGDDIPVSADVNISDRWEKGVTATTVVNRHHSGASYDVGIQRGPGGTVPKTGQGKWGNPFEVGDDKDGTREECIEKFRRYILEGGVEKYDGTIWDGRHLLEHLHEIRGKRLGCTCKPKDCHGDVLVELADS